MRSPITTILVIVLAVATLAISQSVTRNFSAAERLGSSAAGIKPHHFGFLVPDPEPALPPAADAFDPPAYMFGRSGPLIAEISRSADRGEVVSMTGVNLDKPAEFRIFAQAVGAAQGTVTSTLPLTADKTAATLLMPATLPPWSMYLLWPARENLQGPPVAINRTEAWWIGPDREVPASVVSVYGRNLAHANGTSRSYIYFKPASGIGWFVEPTSVSPFRVEFRVPDLPSAVYEVWIHNGHGGRYGWSGPLQFDLLAQSPWAGQGERVINAKSFGALGDGVTDDTAAIQRGLEAAGKSAPATFYLPAGRYRVAGSLVSPGNVMWLGDGMDATEISLSRDLESAMVVSEVGNVQFRRLTLGMRNKPRNRPVLGLSSSKNTRVEAVRIEAWGNAAFDAQNAEGLVVEASELIENGSFYGASHQIFFMNNSFRMTGNGESVVALWGGRDFAMIGNRLFNADESRDDGHGIGRFFVGQSHFGSMRNLYWEDNVSHNAAAFDCSKVDCNKGEQICFEIAGSHLRDDFVAATQDTVTFRSPVDWKSPALPGGMDLVIVGGRGAGQHRRIISAEGSTVTLESSWNVIPDRTSRIALAATASRAAIYRNTFEGRDSYDEHDSDSTAVLLFGSVYDVVVDSNIISRMRHGMMTIALDATRGLSPYFLQYSNNRVMQSNSGLYVGTTFTDAGLSGVWGGLGNIYRKNLFTDLAYIGVEYETWDHEGSDFNGIVFDGNRFDGLRYGFVDAYKIMWTHDGHFKRAPSSSHPRRINTVLYRNSFNRDPAGPDDSAGFLSMHPENTWLDIGSRWAGFATGSEGPSHAAIPLSQSE